MKKPSNTMRVRLFFPHMRPRPANAAFTLVEIMIVVAVIALLAAVAIPSFMRTRMDALRTTFIEELRVASDAFAIKAMSDRAYPPETTPGVVPAGMEEHLRRVKWKVQTPIGGFWDWDNNQFGFKAGVSVYKPGLTEEEMKDIDRRIDDGNLGTGMFRKRPDGYIYILEY